MRPQHQPDGIDLVVDAVHALDQVRTARIAAEKALEAARDEEAKAEARLRDLVAHGKCEDDCPPAKVVVPAVLAREPNVFKITLPPSTPICWRIAFRLLESPELDYQATAAAIWGPDLDKTVAKNRVGAQLTRLKQLEVISTLGGNRYKVNAKKLVEHSGIPIPPDFKFASEAAA